MKQGCDLLTSRCMAAVDIGTNSSRLLIASVENREITRELATLMCTRIGEGVEKNGLLGEQAMVRTMTVLQGYLALINKYPVSRMRVMATSALREAANAAFFVKRVRKEIGCQVEVISGVEEARLTYLGACGTSLPKGMEVVVDIGGGSTEFIYPDLSCVGGVSSLKYHSLPLGAVRLTEEPRLLSEILGPMKDILLDLQKLPSLKLIGLGGTITSLAAIDQGMEVYDAERIHNYLLRREAVERIMFFLAVKNSEERKKLPGLDPGRADIIIAGTTILWAILSFLEVKEIRVSEADILEGMILDMM